MDSAERTFEYAAAPGVTSSWFSEVQVEAEEWLIHGLVPKRSYTGLFGRRGSAKTFLALDLVLNGALGQPFLGQETERFGSIYCVGEKKSRFGKRIAAWKIARGVDDVPVMFRWGTPDLTDPDAVGVFIEEVNDAKSGFRDRGAPLGLIVLDTLARCLKHGNVSDADTAGAAIESIQRIIDDCGVTVLPLAHVAKAETSDSFKGAGEWEDAADALIRIERDGTSALRTVTLTKQSDEADGGAYAFELDVIEVGLSAKGRKITSCVIRQVDIDADCGTKGAPRKLSAEAQTVLRAFDRLADAGQTNIVPLHPGVALNTAGVTLDDLRDSAYSLGLKEALKPEADAPKVEHSRWLGSRRKAFQRAVEGLETARVLRQEGGLLWRL